MKHLNILFLLLFLSNFVFSQGLINNGATIVIESGAYMYIDGGANGNYFNEVSGGDGEIDIDGDMIVEGNFTNNATNNVFINIEVVPDGTVQLKGTTTQTIGGTATTTFEKLTINNTAAGTAVTLSINATVEGTLTLTDGGLFLNSKILTIENSATTAITGGGVNSYVVSETDAATNNSILQWNIGSTTGAHIFPFGTAAGDYIPVTFNNTGNTSGNVSISTRTTAADDNLPWATGVTSMAGAGTNVTTAADRWWDISCGTNPVVGGADVIFSYLGTENATTTDPTAERGVQHWNGSYWNDGKGGDYATVTSSGNAGVTGAAIGTVAVIGLTEFSPYVVVKAATPLPIDLLYFNAVCKNNVAEISWQTASETNNDYFTIEKSPDGIYFKEIAQIIGAGNSNNVLSYSFIDNEPFDKTSYYRLKQTDFDGNYLYFDLVSANCNDTEELDNIFIFTTPESDNIVISFNCDIDETYNIYFIDQLGRTVIQKQITVSGPNEKILISKSNLAIGIYNVILRSANNVVCKQVSIIR